MALQYKAYTDEPTQQQQIAKGPKVSDPDSREKNTHTFLRRKRIHGYNPPINKVKMYDEKKEFWVHRSPRRFLLNSIGYIQLF